MSVPPQPTLHDGEVVLRPWTLDDVDAARLYQDQEVAHGLGYPADIGPGENQRQAIEQWHRSYAKPRRVVSCGVEHTGLVRGTAERGPRGEGRGELGGGERPRRGVRGSEGAE
mgnify:CR=1 FL=1